MTDDTAHRSPSARTSTGTLPDNGFAFLTELHRRLQDRQHAPQDVLDAVALLTATADPARADRLRPRTGEPPALIQRLAVWALHRVDADTVTLAHTLLLGEAPQDLLRAGAAAPCHH